MVGVRDQSQQQLKFGEHQRLFISTYDHLGLEFLDHCFLHCFSNTKCAQSKATADRSIRQRKFVWRASPIALLSGDFVLIRSILLWNLEGLSVFIDAFCSELLTSKYNNNHNLVVAMFWHVGASWRKSPADHWRGCHFSNLKCLCRDCESWMNLNVDFGRTDFFPRVVRCGNYAQMTMGIEWVVVLENGHCRIETLINQLYISYVNDQSAG